MSLSLTAQSAYGVDRRSAMGGHKRCQQPGGCQDKDGEAQRRNVHGSGTLQKLACEIARAQRKSRSRNQSGKQDLQCLAQKERPHLRARRSQCHADADLRGSSRHPKREQSIEPKRCQGKRQRAKNARKASQERLRGKTIGKLDIDIGANAVESQGYISDPYTTWYTSLYIQMR
jgi:hypothetical protein